MPRIADRLPAAVAVPAGPTVHDLVRRLALAGFLLAALTVLASIALTVQN